ncbi:hypothetical protein [Pelistega indica]|uniref:hypothetical protein n=1 Tax=Pelistega indica TaxID=1414851 RepID=UPI0011CBFF8A|nr:hypothetical protein [Pelistega indica]
MPIDATSPSSMFQMPEPLYLPIPQETIYEVAFSMAMAEHVSEDDLEGFLLQFDITPIQFANLSSSPIYARALAEAKAFIKENGANRGFKVRARYYVERLVDDMYKMARDKGTDPSLRLKMFETLAKYADVDPSADKKGKEGASGTVINISVGQGIRGISDMPTVVIDNGGA